LLQIHNAYIVAPTDDGLMIVDQHALHERILYNEFKRRLAGSGLTGQKMLIPETLSITAAEADLLQNAADLLERLGIEVAPFGPNTVALQQYPTVLAERGVDAKTFLREMLDKLAEDETGDEERMLEKVLATMSCKAAVKAGDSLSGEEMQDLLAAAETIDKRSACPHGRPTTLRLSLADLDKQFHRT
jgi:DNA mismatch repair protein MutL